MGIHHFVHHRPVWERGARVALQAEQVDVAVLQHVRIGPSMRNVAARAPFHPDGSVLKHEWPLLVGMALEADDVPGIRSPDLPHQMVGLPDTGRSVLVVAVGALDQALIDPMVLRHIELGLLLQMAGVAKSGLFLDQQELFRGRVVRRVAVDAADVVLPVE